MMEMEHVLRQMAEFSLDKMEEFQTAEAAQIAANQEEMEADINAEATAIRTRRLSRQTPARNN
jgi:hypothetical protein